MNSPAAPSTPPKSVPPVSETVPMDEPTIVPPNPPSVKSTKSPGVPIAPSLIESPIEQCTITTQGPPPAGVEAEQQAKLIVAEAMSGGNTDPSLYNEASPVTLQGQQTYRGSPMSITRPSPIDQHQQAMMYNSPASQVWDGNMGMSPMGPLGRGSPLHQGIITNKSRFSFNSKYNSIIGCTFCDYQNIIVRSAYSELPEYHAIMLMLQGLYIKQTSFSSHIIYLNL